MSEPQGETKTAPNQPEHPSQAEGSRDIGGPGAETANTDSQRGSDPSRPHPSQAEGDRDTGNEAGEGQ